VPIRPADLRGIGQTGSMKLQGQMRHRSRRKRNRRTTLVAASVAGAFALAACGGGDGGGSAEPSEQLPAVADQVALLPASDVASNQLPDVVVDNLNDDNKVNLRNYAPADRPILLWMWAPH